MIYLSCPKCDADVEFTFDMEEILSGMLGCRLVPVVDQIIKDCACEWSDAERQEMIEAAERAAGEME
jgi:hypothetical protein